MQILFFIILACLSFSSPSHATQTCLTPGGILLKSTSYSGYNCDQNKTLCNPFIFGLNTADNTPVCLNAGKNCYREIKVGEDTHFPESLLAHQKQQTDFKTDFKAFCANPDTLSEDLKQKCLMIRRQEVLNARRRIGFYSRPQISNSGHPKDGIY